MKPQYHDFYNEKKDHKLVLCVYDQELAKEKVDMADLSPQQLSKLFKVREISKRFFGNFSILVRILIFKPVATEEDTIFLEKPYIWQNLRKYITIVDFYNEKDPSILELSEIGCKGLTKIYPLNIEYVDRKSRYTFTPTVQNAKKFYLTKNLILASAKKSLLQGHKVEVVR